MISVKKFSRSHRGWFDSMVLIFLGLVSITIISLGTAAESQTGATREELQASELIAPLLVNDTVPASAFGMIGEQVVFTATFSNGPAANFQWQRVFGKLVYDLPDATNTTLTLTNLQLADAASYRLKAVNATNSEAITYTSARPLLVERLPSAVGSMITVVSAQTGLGGTTSFTPTWSIDTNNDLIAGRLPSRASGNFSLEISGRQIGHLTDGNDGTLTLITSESNERFPITCSTNYVTCGNLYRAGSSLTYQLEGSRTGYDLTNITVYGGWANNGRDQQAYTVYYSTVAAPAMFVLLGSVNYDPANPDNVQSATRLTLRAALGVLATNVAAVRFDFTKPDSKNGYCGYSQIILAGSASKTMPPASFVADDSNVIRNAGSYAVNSLEFLGSWIWDTNTFDQQTCYFWRLFEIPPNKPVRNAILILSVDNEFTLYLDGRLIGREAEWREYWEYDVTLLMTPGSHVLGVNAYNTYAQAGMIFGLHIDFEDETAMDIKSDPSWKLAPHGSRHWETRKTAPITWRPATIVGELGQSPWGLAPEILKAGPPLQSVKIAFWQTKWFQIIFATLCGLFLLTIFFLAAQLALHQKERWLLQRERARIAMDVHDDIGSRITQLVLNGEVAKEDLTENSKTWVQLGEICDDARRVLSSIDEILWALNPRLDTLQDFANYICDYAHKYLEPSAIECVFEVDPKMQFAEADLPLRRSLLMAMKETLNNIVKHSEATELRLKIERQRQRLIVVMQDNGKGFEPTEIKPGRNGLGNLSRRMQELGGSCQITSHPGQGCRIEFSIPLKRPRRLWLLKKL